MTHTLFENGCNWELAWRLWQHHAAPRQQSGRDPQPRRNPRQHDPVAAKHPIQEKSGRRVHPARERAPGSHHQEAIKQLTLLRQQPPDTRLMWLITMYEVSASHANGLQMLVSSHVRKWFGLPRCLSSVGLYCNKALSKEETHMEQDLEHGIKQTELHHHHQGHVWCPALSHKSESLAWRRPFYTTLHHILVGCKTSLTQGWYTWQHKKMLRCLTAERECKRISIDGYPPNSLTTRQCPDNLHPLRLIKPMSLRSCVIPTSQLKQRLEAGRWRCAEWRWDAGAL